MKNIKFHLEYLTSLKYVKEDIAMLIRQDSLRM